MLNNFILVGRIATIKNIQNETKVTIACNRSYKNENGLYETDFIKIKLNGNLATQTTNYCKVGDLIGAKGRIESDGLKINLVAEKITFLSSKGGKE